MEVFRNRNALLGQRAQGQPLRPQQEATEASHRHSQRSSQDVEPKQATRACRSKPVGYRRNPKVGAELHLQVRRQPTHRDDREPRRVQTNRIESMEPRKSRKREPKRLHRPQDSSTEEETRQDDGHDGQHVELWRALHSVGSTRNQQNVGRNLAEEGSGRSGQRLRPQTLGAGRRRRNAFSHRHVSIDLDFVRIRTVVFDNFV